MSTSSAPDWQKALQRAGFFATKLVEPLGKHKDLGQGLGVIDVTEEDFEEARTKLKLSSSKKGSSKKHNAQNYLKTAQTKETVFAKIKSISNLKSIIIKSFMKRFKNKVNSWMFVMDRNGRLYVGIEIRGKFQHSSFVAIL
ncbi:hypothetical protein PPACK8108_LOCUS1601 [Phakopsora pachyrhizi]|uniref:Uncharacterized protein n=1 Tax=Phakopsora pachyrhizi TaxID=170000 RepID=A0AAV0AIJ6_PHAPC|nr:hypothetical protein PPACK8108_LOCUS1601 [Phakopsora pachyrhizi]